MVYNQFRFSALKTIAAEMMPVNDFAGGERLTLMLFRPNFCANCGEKIERVDWGIFTSRRFCPVCETEFKGQDLIPRAIVLIGLFVGVVGAGSYLRTGTAAISSVPTRQAAKMVDQRPIESIQSPVKNEATLPPVANATASATIPQTPATQFASNPVQKQRVQPDEQAYYCGAETKKGTPCTRRVKGNIRCFQHTGMPAMLPPEKLRIG